MIHQLQTETKNGPSHRLEPVGEMLQIMVVLRPRLCPHKR